MHSQPFSASLIRDYLHHSYSLSINFLINSLALGYFFWKWICPSFSTTFFLPTPVWDLDLSFQFHPLTIVFVIFPAVHKSLQNIPILPSGPTSVIKRLKISYWAHCNILYLQSIIIINNTESAVYFFLPFCFNFKMVLI